MSGLLLAMFLGLQSFRPSLPVFGGGPLTNLDLNCDACLTNASAHVAWAIAIPMLGEKTAGRKGMWIAGLSWIGVALVTEGLFHAPPHAGAAYPSEVRTDLLTKLVPCVTILVIDLIRNGR